MSEFDRIVRAKRQIAAGLTECPGAHLPPCSVLADQKRGTCSACGKETLLSKHERCVRSHMVMRS